MSVAQNSALVRVVLAIWAVLLDGWAESLPGRGCARIGAAICRGVAGSGICQFVWREGSLPKAWPHSVACRLGMAIINLPCALFKWIYKACRGVWDGSFALRLISALGGVSFLFLGLMMLVMLMAPHSMWNNIYGLLGILCVTALFVVGSSTRPKHRLELDRLGPYMLLYMGFICYALLTSLSTRASMRFFGFHLTCFLLVLLVVSAVRRYEQVHLLAALAVLGITAAALYGCYQGYVGVDVVASQQDMAINADMPGRVYSFFDNPNNFAELLVMLIPLDFALFLNAKGWRGRVLSLAALVPCVVAIGYTYSRSGWIGLALAVAVFLALQNWRFIPLMLVAGICAIPFLPESIYHRILTIGNLKDTSTRYRFAIYEATGNLMHDYWWRGVGLGSDVMKQVFQTYPTMFDGNYPIHTHNNYLQMWGETGILGVLSYLALLLYQVKSGAKAFYACADRRVKNLLAASLAGFCGILVIGMAEYTWFYARNMFLYWFLFGIIGACVKLARSHGEQQAA